MPLPLIIVGGLVAAGTLYGYKKGLEAKDDSDEANKLNKKVQDIYEKAEVKEYLKKK